MSSPVSGFAEKLVFGTQRPRTDPEGLRRLAAAWREFAASCGHLQELIDGGVLGLQGAFNERSAVGRSVMEVGSQLGTRAERLSGFGVAVADWLDDVANDVELALAEMSVLLIAVLCAGTSVAAAAQARARFLVLLEGLISRIGMQSTAVAMARAGLFVAEGVMVGVVQAGLNAGIQWAQPTRRGVDWEAVLQSGLSGTGSAMGSRLGAGLAVRVVGDGLQAGWGRAVVAAGAGMFGVLGAAAATGGVDPSLTQWVSGGLMGLAAHSVSAARHRVPVFAAPPTSGVSRVSTLVPARDAGSVRGDETVARLGRMSEQQAIDQLFVLSSRAGSSVQLVGPGGRGQVPGGDGGSLTGLDGVVGQPGVRGAAGFSPDRPGGGDSGVFPTRTSGDSSWGRPAGPPAGSNLRVRFEGSPTGDRVGLQQMGFFGSIVRGGDGQPVTPASMGTEQGLASMWRDTAGGAVTDGVVGRPVVAEDSRVGVREPDLKQKLAVRPETGVETVVPTAARDAAAATDDVSVTTSAGTRAADGATGSVSNRTVGAAVEPQPGRSDRGESEGSEAADTYARSAGVRSKPDSGRLEVTSDDLPLAVIPILSTPPGVEELRKPDSSEIDVSNPNVPELIPTLDPMVPSALPQPPRTRLDGVDIGGSGWLPAIQPWGPVVPDTTRPGAPYDPTLQPPVLDKTSPRPHVIEPPGWIPGQSEPDDFPEQPAPISDIPSSMPDPLLPIQFRAADEPESSEPPRAEGSTETLSDDRRTSTAPLQEDHVAATPPGSVAPVVPGGTDTLSGLPGGAATEEPPMAAVLSSEASDAPDRGELATPGEHPLDHALPVTELPDDRLAAKINALETALGITSRAERMIELSLYMEDKFRFVLLAQDHDRPELLFGAEEYAAWLDARYFAREYRGALTVGFLQELHMKLANETKPAIAGKFKSSSRADAGHWGRLLAPLTEAELAAIAANPVLSYVVPKIFSEYGAVTFTVDSENGGARRLRLLNSPLTEPEIAAIRADPLQSYIPGPFDSGEYGIIMYPFFPGTDGLRQQVSALCDWYADQIQRTDVDTYHLAAEMQRAYVSLHPHFDYNGRLSRILMNWILERAGRYPSALVDFERDILTFTDDWAREIEAGSRRYRDWHQQLRWLGPVPDLIALFGLTQFALRLAQVGSEFVPGDFHDHRRYDELYKALQTDWPTWTEQRPPSRRGQPSGGLADQRDRYLPASPWSAHDIDPAEQALVRAARAGDIDAFRTLDARYANEVFFRVLAVVRNGQVARDITELTFRHAVVDIKSAPLGIHILEWFVAIARRLTQEHSRFVDFRRRLRDSVLWASDSAERLRMAEAVATLPRSQLEKGLQRLPYDSRAVLVERLWDETSVADIAHTLGLEESTVENWQRFAVHQLTRTLVDPARPVPSTGPLATGPQVDSGSWQQAEFHLGRRVVFGSREEFLRQYPAAPAEFFAGPSQVAAAWGLDRAGAYAVAEAYALAYEHLGPFNTAVTSSQLTVLREQVARNPATRVMCVARDGQLSYAGLWGLDYEFWAKHCGLFVLSKQILEAVMLDYEATVGARFPLDESYRSYRTEIAGKPAVRRVEGPQRIAGALQHLTAHLNRNGFRVGEPGSAIVMLDDGLKGAATEILAALYEPTEFFAHFTVLTTAPMDPRPDRKMGHAMELPATLWHGGPVDFLPDVAGHTFLSAYAISVIERLGQGPMPAADGITASGPVYQSRPETYLQPGWEEPYRIAEQYRPPMVRQAVRVAILLAAAHYAHDVRTPTDPANDLIPFTEQVRSWLLYDGRCVPALETLFDSFCGRRMHTLGSIQP